MKRHSGKTANSRSASRPAKSGGVSLNRVFSKLGIASRTEAERLIRAGRVSVDGRTIHEPELRIDMDRSVVALDGTPLAAQKPVYLMINKPRGLVTTLNDPQGRDTVFRCLDGLDLPHVSPVGRLDKASEGLLLMTNDTRFAQGLLDPETGPEKVYHVQIDTLPEPSLATRLMGGVDDAGEWLRATHIVVLRRGSRNAWLEVTLDEGRNRHIRRLLASFGIEVLRLIRVSIGPLALGDLPKGSARHLEPEEVAMLTSGISPHPAEEP